MKTRNRFIGLVLSVLLAILCMTAVLCSCGEKTLDKVSTFSFDFRTGDYTFGGIENAEEYRVRIFPLDTNENGEKVESELPINESNAIRGGKESYSGNVPLWSLTPGETYNVYVLATSEEYGDSVSDAKSGMYECKYDTVTGGVIAEYSFGKIVVDLSNDAISDYYDSETSLEVTLYKDGKKVESATVAHEDILSETTGGNNGNSSGGGSTDYSATLSFAAEDGTGYSVTVKVIAVSAGYLDSDESEKFDVSVKSFG